MKNARSAARAASSAVPPPAESPPLPLWASACFFASGAAGLLYEVVWSKELSHVFGNSLHSISTVVAAFLCGLALGAWQLGARLSRPGAGTRTYAVLEVGIAVLGIASVPVLRALDPLVGALYHGLGGSGAAFALARFVLLFVLLVPPTMLMGATLPVLVDHFEHRLVGPALARLYAINTAGAVAGSLLGGFLLVPQLGLLATTWVAAALNLAVALIAWFAVRPGAPAGAVEAEAPSVPAATRAGLEARQKIVAASLALSGFAALAFQIAWVRLFGLVLGSSVYSFSGVLGVYLAGLAVGAAWIGRRLRRSVELTDFAVLQISLALAAAAVLWLFPWLPEWYFAIARDAGGNWFSLLFSQLGLVAAVLFVPCVLLGAIFPLATRLMQTSGGGRAAGLAYAVNTLGTIAGALLAGFVLVPRLGVQGTHLVALAASLAAGLLIAAFAWREAGARRLVPALVLGAVAIAIAVPAPRWDPALMSAGIFRPQESARVQRAAAASTGAGPLVRRFAHHDRLLYYREGLLGSVYVSTDSTGRDIVLRVGGKVDASTVDMLTQVLSGLLPAALADSNARTLVIGQGSGVTLSAALAAGAGQTDLVELEPAVLEASRFFHPRDADPLADPRVHVIVEDGRTVLAYARAPYDLIISEPSNPWLAGLNNLFTLDFYRLVRSRLAPGGVFCQWIQLYEISPTTFASILSGFLAEFPRGYAFLAAGGQDLLLIAAPEERSFSLARLRGAAARRELARAGILGPEAVAGFYVAPFDSLRAIVRGATLNRDDRPVVEYRAPRDLVERGHAALRGEPTIAASLPAGDYASAQRLFAAWTPAQWFTGRIRQLVRLDRFDRARAAVDDAVHSGHAELAATLRATLDDAERRRAAGRLLVEARDQAQAGRAADARATLERVVAITPDHARAWVLLSNLQRDQGQYDAALRSAERGAATGQALDRADALVSAGLTAIALNRPADAAQHFAEAQRWNPSAPLAYAFEARARLDAGDRAGAIAALGRGLAASPGDPQLESMRQQLASQ